jgi:hypothetical protein
MARRFYYIIILFLASAVSLQAQNEESKDSLDHGPYYWLELGGTAGYGASINLALNAELIPGYHFGAHSVQAISFFDNAQELQYTGYGFQAGKLFKDHTGFWELRVMGGMGFLSEISFFGNEFFMPPSEDEANTFVSYHIGFRAYGHLVIAKQYAIGLSTGFMVNAGFPVLSVGLHIGLGKYF